MNEEEEKEARLQNHIKYWELIDKIGEIATNAVNELSISDIISALDRVKVGLMQQEVIAMVGEELQREAEEEESEIENEVTQPPQANLKAVVLNEKLDELIGGVRSSLLNN